MGNDDPEDAIYVSTLVTFWSGSHVWRPAAGHILNVVDLEDPPSYNAKKHRLPLLSSDTSGMLDHRRYVRVQCYMHPTQPWVYAWHRVEASSKEVAGGTSAVYVNTLWPAAVCGCKMIWAAGQSLQSHIS